MNFTKLLLLIAVLGCITGCRRLDGGLSNKMRTKEKFKEIFLVLSEFDPSMVESLNRCQSTMCQNSLNASFVIILGEKYSQNWFTDAWHRDLKAMATDGRLIIWSSGPNGKDEHTEGDDLSMVMPIGGRSDEPFGRPQFYGW